LSRLAALANVVVCTLPAQIGELKNLTKLYLYGNQLSTLPAQIGELKNLTTLYLYNNQLSSLPAQIGELKNLWYLDLQVNKFSKEEQEQIRKLLPKCAVMF
jgi:Leucine-rich repeat (LRR) protein